MHLGFIGKLFVSVIAAKAVTDLVIVPVLNATRPSLTAHEWLRQCAYTNNWIAFNRQLDALGFPNATYDQRCEAWYYYLR